MATKAPAKKTVKTAEAKPAVKKACCGCGCKTAKK